MATNLKLCAKCNSTIEEKVDKTAFYCDNCYVEAAEAFAKMQKWIDNL